MRVLFVSSGNSEKGIGTVVLNQAESLKKNRIDVDFFTIKGKGIAGYLRSIPGLRKHVRDTRYDIIHSHYSLSGFVASFISGSPLVVSLMGSDAYLSGLWRVVIRLFSKIRWNATIVKTERMKKTLRLPEAIVVPNGVDLDRFSPRSKLDGRKHLQLNPGKKLVVFVADPGRPEKNFSLAQETIQFMNREDVELLAVSNVAHIEIPFYLYAADALILTSKWEGSVNVVKEAMACNLPVVSTDVGDVKENLKDVNGCFICEPNPGSMAEGLERAFQKEDRTNGREILISLKLDSDSIAEKIISIYNEVTT